MFIKVMLPNVVLLCVRKYSYISGLFQSVSDCDGSSSLLFHGQHCQTTERATAGTLNCRHSFSCSKRILL